jgi:hypothetical protein
MRFGIEAATVRIVAKAGDERAAGDGPKRARRRQFRMTSTNPLGYVRG